MNRDVRPSDPVEPGKRWLQDCTRRFMVGLHIPDYDQVADVPGQSVKILERFDARAWIRALKAAHVQMFWFYSKCHMGNSYHPSAVPGSHVHTAMKGRDIFGELVTACEAAGIVPGCVYECSDHRVIRDKPEWCHRIPAAGTVDITDADQGSRIGGPCLRGPYGEYMIAQLVETFTKYPAVRALYMDFLGFFGHDNWQCPHGCGERLAAVLGAPFRGVKSLDHGQYVAYLRWKIREYVEYTERLITALRAVRPDLVFLHNAHLVTDGPNMQTYETAQRLCDYVSGDLFHLRAGALQMSTVLRSYAGASRILPSEALLDTGISIGSDGCSPKARDSYRAELWTARSVNVTNCTSIMSNLDGTLDAPILALVRDVYAEQKPFEPWLRDMQFRATVGVVRSQNTILNRPPEGLGEPPTVYRVDYGKPFHALEFKGWAQALIMAHQLWDLVQDYQLTDEALKRFNVLILPNAGCLSDAQCEAVARFVRAGGALIATGESSRFDEDGRLRPDLALADLMGVRVTGPANLAPARLQPPRRAPYMRNPYEAAFVHFNVGHWPVRVDAGGVVEATWRRRHGERGLVFPFEDTGLPALVRRRVGKGSVTYVSGLPGANFRLWGFSSQKRLMRYLVERAVGRAAPVTLEAPETVELFAHGQVGREQLVVNLVNWVTGVSRSDGSSITGGLKLESKLMRFDEVEAMPPVAGAALTFRAPPGRVIRRVYQAPTRARLHGQRLPGGVVRVVLKPFDVHAMVVAEYGVRTRPT